MLSLVNEQYSTNMRRPLKDIAVVIRGVTYKKDKASDIPCTDGLPILRAGNISDRLVLDNNLIWVPKELVSEAQKLKRGDIIICMSSGSSRVVGKSAFLDYEWEGTFGAFLASIRTNPEECLPEYLAFYMRTSEFRNWTSESSGVNIKNIRKSELENYCIPIPSIDEQRRIVDILKRADSIRQLRKQADEISRQLIPLLFIDIFGDPVMNPKGWTQKKLGDLLSAIESGWSPKCDNRPASNNEWGVLKLSAVTWGEYSGYENKALPSGLDPRPELEVREGDLLFTRKNTKTLVAATAIATKTDAKLMLPDLIFRLQIANENEINKEYLWGVLSNISKRQEIQELASGAASSMPNISKAKLRTIKIPIPPIGEQQKFTQLMKQVKAIQTLQDTAIEASNICFQSILNRHFSSSE